VVARLLGLTDRTKIKAAAEAMTPAGRAGDFAQALMDLGAQTCRPRAPLCGTCPISADCRAFALGTPGAFPAAKPRKARPQRFGAAWWIEREGCLWLVRRPASGLLGGMAALPGPDWQDEPLGKPALATVRHVFTHFSLDLAVLPMTAPEGDGWWQPLDRIAEAGLPTLYRRAVEDVLAGRTAIAA
jgi:A/G-specific adenine glycosylase